MAASRYTTMLGAFCDPSVPPVQSPAHQPRPSKALAHRLFAHRHGGVALLVAMSLMFALVTRVALLLKAHAEIGWSPSLAASFGWGLLYDLGESAWWALPIAILLAALPAGCFEHRLGRALAHFALFGFFAAKLFGAVGEWLFWDEFATRYNFIAVEYLIYTREVVSNIRESYPLPWIFSAITGGALALHLLVWHRGWLQLWFAHARQPAGTRWRRTALIATACLSLGLGLSEEQLPDFSNNYNRELAKNGLWSLFAAFRSNEIDYDHLYSTLPVDDAFATLHTELAADGSRPLTQDPRDTLRLVSHLGTEIHPNIIQITVESLSAEFLGCFNKESTLTPELDALAAKSLVFDQLYATGTRTDRGMEALALSLPPTPGRSLIKRPHNENLFTLGSVLRSRGYDTAFIYGGYGYFDNMNAFFGSNGYRIVDRTAAAKRDITFANAWGACDEDLYRWTMREADADHAAGKPFHFFLMTTSNHRPFTFPDGRIDLPSKTSGRAGGVRYTDYAIGKFIADSAAKPWFKNTIFVIVADHCASSAGRAALPVQKYWIPMMVYAPGGQIAPGHVPDLMSQIDYAPTLLGLLRWTYASRFFGWDVTRASGDRRALIGNYQRLGLYEPGTLTVLQPPRLSAEFSYDNTTFALTPRADDTHMRGEAIAYYQTASYLYHNRGYVALSPEDQRRLEIPASLPVAPTSAPAPVTTLAAESVPAS